MENKVKYLEVYYTIRNDILAGTYKIGDFLPVETEFCKTLAVGRTTLRRALAMLTEEGLLSAKQGRGTMVISNTTKDSHITGSKQQLLLPTPKFSEPWVYTQSRLVLDIMFCSEKVSKEMNLPAGSKVYRIQRIRYVNNKSYCYLVNYINPKVVPDLEKHADELGDHITEYLVKKYGTKRTAVRSWLDIGHLDFKEAQFLGMEINRPVFVTKRVSHVGADVFDYSEMMLNPDIMEMRYSSIPNPDLDIITLESFAQL